MTQNTPQEPLPYAQYRSTQEAPLALRTLGSARLSLEQINWINRRAHELRDVRVIEERVNDAGVTVPGGEVVVQNFQAARAEFMEAHRIDGDLWVRRKQEVN